MTLEEHGRRQDFLFFWLARCEVSACLETAQPKSSTDRLHPHFSPHTMSAIRRSLRAGFSAVRRTVAVDTVGAAGPGRAIVAGALRTQVRRRVVWFQKRRILFRTPIVGAAGGDGP
jgi:hypothetical protein